ncbi:MAG: polyprenyl synthetase family protein [Candidatus Eisenbacteria bacterium]
MGTTRPPGRTISRSDSAAPRAGTRAAATGATGGGGAGAWARWLEAERPRIERALRRCLPSPAQGPPNLRAAMLHALFPGGKRLRPALCLLGHRFAGGADPEAYRLAAAIEMLHAFSLVHDDLPCMDDDDFRRGRPTVHRAFGEGIAVLAGDALLNRAYETVGSLAAPPARVVDVLRILTSSMGGEGVLGGQVEDLEAEGKHPTELELRRIHRRKTALLLSGSLEAGAALAGASGAALDPLHRFGIALGLLFQLADDLLNVVGTAEQLGRPAGGDARHAKATYPSILGLAGARERLERRRRLALAAAQSLEPVTEVAQDLVRVVVARVPQGGAHGEEEGA